MRHMVTVRETVGIPGRRITASNLPAEWWVLSDAVRGLMGALLGCLIALTGAAGELLQVSQYVIEGADDGGAARNSRERGPHDRAGYCVQVHWGEP